MRIEWEGPAPRVLFVCSAGLLRSPTAAFLAAREWGWNTRACGTRGDALIPVSAALLTWADRVVCMEEQHRAHILNNYAPLHLEARIEVLGIEDKYARMEPELCKLIVERLATIERLLAFDPSEMLRRLDSGPARCEKRSNER